jgi:hypothetical protein
MDCGMTIGIFPLFSNFNAVDGFRHTGTLIKIIAKVRPDLQIMSLGATPLSSCFFGESIVFPKTRFENPGLRSIEIIIVMVNILKILFVITNY